MESSPDQPPLVVIVGETGSGKSALALDLAQHFNGAVIAADSRTIYRGLDIITAKPSLKDRMLVPHYLVDMLSPDQSFSAAEFKSKAQEAMSEIIHKGYIPFLVGGTGLYVDSIIYDFQFQEKADPKRREALQKLSIEELQTMLRAANIPFPKNERNLRHLVRAVETGGMPPALRLLRKNTLVLGLTIDRDVLFERIRRRVESMVEQGLFNEVQSLVQKYGWDAPGLQTSGFRAFRKYFDHEISIAETKELLVHEHLQLAKRQRTWFRRNKDIHWICKKDEAVDLITTFLNK